jgi:hypothetical protein
MLRIFFKNKKIYYFYIFLNKKQSLLHLQTLLKKQPINFCLVMKKTLLIKRGEMDNREWGREKRVFFNWDDALPGQPLKK